MSWLLLGCHGPGEALPEWEAPVLPEVEEEEPEARVFEDRPPREIAWVGGGLDTAIPEDTGWRYGDDALVAEGGKALDFFRVEDGVATAAYDQQLREVRLPDEPGELPLEDHLGPVLFENYVPWYAWNDLVPHGDGGLATASQQSQLDVFDSSWSDPTLTYLMMVHDIEVGELTGDGLDDVAFVEGHVNTWTPDAGVFSGTTTGTVGREDAHWYVWNDDADAYWGDRLLVADFDGDGFDDLLVNRLLYRGPLPEGVFTIGDADAEIGEGLGAELVAGDTDGDGVEDAAGHAYLLSLQRDGSITADDVIESFDCDGVVTRRFIGVGAAQRDSAVDLVFSLIANTDRYLAHVWVVEAPGSGGVHSCFDEGTLIRNTYGVEVGAPFWWTPAVLAVPLDHHASHSDGIGFIAGQELR